MTPQEFIAKWSRSPRNEHQDAQPHFIDLCRLLNVEDPAQADPRHEWFTFERGASKTTGGSGWADVWRKGHFGWEYKSHGGDLNRAYSQLLNYSGALESPPLLIVSDMEVIRIHTNWTNTVQKVYTLRLPDLADAANRDLLRHCFLDPERLKPAKTRQKLTEEAAEKFASLAQRLRGRGHDPHRVAHFVNRLVFCMFAEDVGLLPDKMFERMIKLSRSKPETFAQQAAKLFAAMKSGGDVGFEPVEWFNGGLFDSDDALPLNWQDIDDLIRASQLDWSDIDPSLLGTLFERGLDPDKRSQLGAHYTDREKIMMIVTPVIEQPLLAEWAAVKAQIQSLAESAPKQTAEKLLRGPDLAARTRAMKDAQALHQSFLDRLRDFRVLDPACGSGNFLYLSLLALKDIEHRVNIEAESLGLPRTPLLLGVGPENLLGIELNPYAARTRPRVRLDRRGSVDAPQRIRGRPQPHPAHARHDRMPRCRACAGWNAGRLAEGRCGGGEPAVFGGQPHSWGTGRGVPEVVPGYPDRLLPVSDAAAKVLKTRTLTNLYNARPAWLAHAHGALDQAVADAYGWGEDWRAGPLPDDEILARLFRLNQKRAGGEILKKD
jgi:hypothetical protein